MQWFSIILQILVLLIGSLLAEGYKNPLYLYWLLVMAVLVICSQTLISNLIKTRGELSNYKSKISAFSTVKENANSNVQIAVFPDRKILKGQEVKLEVFLSSIFPLTSKPDIKLITEEEWYITIDNQPQLGKRYAGNYEYVLYNPHYEIREDKFVKFYFFIKISSHGDKNFMVEYNDGSTRGSLGTSLTVYRS